MITFNVEFQQKLVTPGDQVQGILTIHLSTPHQICSVFLRVVCEVVTRRIKNTDETRVKTDRNFPLDQTIQLFTSTNYAETLEPGAYKYPFNFQIPANFPATICGPDLGWCQKQKYEINYCLEPLVKEKAVSGYLGSKEQKFPFSVYEKPDWGNFPALFQNGPIEKWGETKVGQGCLSEPGVVCFKFWMEHMYGAAGEDFPLVLTIENRTKKPVSKVFICLNKIVDYNVASNRKHKVLEVNRNEYDVKIQPDETECMDVVVPIPATTPGSTPSVFDRKIKIKYEVVAKICVQSSNTVSLFCYGILVSNLKFP